MKTFLAALAAISLVCLAPALHAQDTPDPKRVAAAQELLKAMHADALIDLQKEGMKKALLARLPNNLPPDAQKQLQEKVNTGVDTVLKDYTWDSIQPDFVRLYSSTFTAEELKQLTAFYKSPIGQKYIEKRSEIEGGALALMQKKVQTFMPEIAALVKDVLLSAKAAESAPAPANESAPAPEK